VLSVSDCVMSSLYFTVLSLPIVNCLHCVVIFPIVECLHCNVVFCVVWYCIVLYCDESMHCSFRLQHENIVKLVGYSSDGPFNCIIYDYLSSGSLEDRLACRVSTVVSLFQVRTLFINFVVRFFKTLCCIISLFH